jgi:hypothetical protein
MRKVLQTIPIGQHVLRDDLKIRFRGPILFQYQGPETNRGLFSGGAQVSHPASLKKGDIAMLQRGFYVILPPEQLSLECLPAEQFIRTWWITWARLITPGY